MTLISRLVFFTDTKKTAKQSSGKVRLQEISIVIPVKDNQQGIDNYIEAFCKTQRSEHYPKEIIVVDNNSVEPIDVRHWLEKCPVPISVLHCKQPGAGPARNVGVRNAKGEWVLFNDSDCLPTETLLTGYLNACNRSVGYAGNVHSLGEGAMSKYYQSQEILVPLKVHDNLRGFVPQYLITANCLVWRDAFDAISGFNESISGAGGEDIDLGLRLSQVGHLSYAFDSVAKHNFDDGMVGFYKRFRRYGRGNRTVSRIWNVNLSPRPFRPNVTSPVNWILAVIQFAALFIGYNSSSE